MMRHILISTAAILLLAMTASLVCAAPSAGLIIAQPRNGAIISGSAVEISVTFASNAARPITRVQINLDGASVTERVYDAPLASGDCGFLWDTLRSADGQHRLEALLYSGKNLLGTTISIVRVDNSVKPQETPQPTPPVVDIKAPQVKIASPREGETVSGTVPVIIQAKDDSGKSPYISVFVDNALKAVTNHEPYSYSWDSSQAENGPHEIHVAATDDTENRTVTQPVRIIVRNAEKVMIPVVSAAPETSSAVPRADESALQEAARSTMPLPASHETPAPQIPAAQPAAVLAPLAAETEPVLLAHDPEPEVAVLVSGPVEFNASQPVQMAAARVDEPKKPISTPAPSVQRPVMIEYTVRPGEALWTLARRYGTTVEAIVEANGIEDPSLIRMGRKLLIPEPSPVSTMVSLRSALDQVGGRMDWQAKAHEVHAWAPGADIRLRIGSSRAEVNDRLITMERPAALKSGRTMVPRSFVADTLGIVPSAGR